MDYTEEKEKRREIYNELVELGEEAAQIAIDFALDAKLLLRGYPDKNIDTDPFEKKFLKVSNIFGLVGLVNRDDIKLSHIDACLFRAREDVKELKQP